jgi:hypothetical protein
MDDADDVLSLCDLPLYGGDAVNIEEFSRELDHQSSSSSLDTNEDESYFEFFSEEWNFPYKSQTNIVFCGKLIAYKQPQTDLSRSKRLLQRNSKSISTKSNDSSYKAVASPTKSRWSYLFMFGLSRFPTGNGMELRDMRRRQSRKIKMSSGEKSSSSRGSRSGVWRMIRALGCSGQSRATAVVKAAYVVSRAC